MERVNRRVIPPRLLDDAPEIVVFSDSGDRIPIKIAISGTIPRATLSEIDDSVIDAVRGVFEYDPADNHRAIYVRGSYTTAWGRGSLVPVLAEEVAHCAANIVDATMQSPREEDYAEMVNTITRAVVLLKG